MRKLSFVRTSGKRRSVISLALLLIPIFFLPILLTAQVTSGSISGNVSSASEPLAGASITATHEPTGTVYRTSSLTQGVFNVVNMIPGGPYKIEVSYVGFQTYTQDNLFLALGENTRVDVTLSPASAQLMEVIV